MQRSCSYRFGGIPMCSFMVFNNGIMRLNLTVAHRTLAKLESRRYHVIRKPFPEADYGHSLVLYEMGRLIDRSLRQVDRYVD